MGDRWAGADLTKKPLWYNQKGGGVKPAGVGFEPIPLSRRPCIPIQAAALAHPPLFNKNTREVFCQLKAETTGEAVVKESARVAGGILLFCNSVVLLFLYCL